MGGTAPERPSLCLRAFQRLNRTSQQHFHLQLGCCVALNAWIFSSSLDCLLLRRSASRFILCRSRSMATLPLKLTSSLRSECDVFAHALGETPLLSAVASWTGFASWKRKTVVLFAQLACPQNYVCGTGTKISGTGSTTWKFSAPDPVPAIQNCLGSDWTVCDGFLYCFCLSILAESYETINHYHYSRVCS